MTIHEKISKLEPGHAIVISKAGLSKSRFWDLDLGKALSGRSGLEYEHKKLFVDAVRKHMISDAPLGAFLSGGVDSTAIVSAMSQLDSNPVSTFTIGFAHASNKKDIELSRYISRSLGTQHHEHIMSPDIQGMIDDIVWYADEPFAVTSAIPIYVNAQFAKEKVDVVLAGDGADEIYGGYNRYLLFKIVRALRKRFKSLSEPALSILADLLSPANASSRIGKVRDLYLKKIINAMSQPDDFLVYQSLFPNISVDSELVLSEAALDAAKDHNESDWDERLYFSSNDPVSLSMLLYFDSKTSLVDEMLTKIDRMTMAHSLEARVPYLDHRLVEFMFKVPDSMKVPGVFTKQFMKQSLREFVPSRLSREPKRGFNLPIDHWLRNDLREYLESVLTQSNISSTGMLNADHVLRLKQLHTTGRVNLGARLWSIMVFVRWSQLCAIG